MRCKIETDSVRTSWPDAILGIGALRTECKSVRQPFILDCVGDPKLCAVFGEMYVTLICIAEGHNSYELHQSRSTSSRSIRQCRALEAYEGLQFALLSAAPCGLYQKLNPKRQRV